MLTNYFAVKLRCFLVYTKDECKKIFYGIIIAPITAVNVQLLGKSMIKPLPISSNGGSLRTKLIKKQIPIIPINIKNPNSKTFYPSSYKNNIPITISNTSGIPNFSYIPNNNLRAMTAPTTSYISALIIAIS